MARRASIDLSVLSDGQLRCAVNHFHALTPFNPRGNPTYVPQNGYRDSQRCINCRTERHDVYNRTGALEYRRYVEPPEWVRLKRLPKTEFVHELARRKEYQWPRQRKAKADIVPLRAKVSRARAS